MKDFILKKDNGKDVTINLHELDFVNVLCDIEDKGVDLFAFSEGKSISFKDVRTIFAAIIDEKDVRKAGSIMSEHMRNGGKIEDIFSVFEGMMIGEGFGNDSTPEAAASQK